ncbi:MAG TPA: glyoxylate/hydroxypyruvate reductase A [Casimicrobiaceae bacterium]|nr:glyoxylate/hydroxypyruvate reductase A [Casimicrobiaceae bacterium]
MNRGRLAILIATPSKLAWKPAIERVLPEADVHVWPDSPDDVDFALVWKPPGDLFERVRVRRAIMNLGAGVDALFELPTLPSDVSLLRITDAGMATQMAEYVTLAVLRAYREQDAYAESQRNARWQPRKRLAKSEFSVGFLGVGVLASAVARALKPFEFPLLGWRRSAQPAEAIEVFAPDALDRMLARTRVLVVMLPLTGQTRGIVDGRMLRALPRGSHLVNVARGPLVVEQDLLDALDDGHLASATLDVFDEEPLPSTHRFWHHPKIVITPHVSAVTLLDESAEQVAAKLRAFVRGEPVDGIVDRKRGY